MPTFATKKQGEGRPRGSTSKGISGTSERLPYKPPAAASATSQVPKILQQQLRLAAYCYARAASAFQQGRDNLGLSFVEKHTAIARTVSPYISSRMLAINPAESSNNPAKPMAYVIEPMASEDWSARFGAKTPVVDATVVSQTTAPEKRVESMARADATSTLQPARTQPQPSGEGPQQGQPEGKEKPPVGLRP